MLRRREHARRNCCRLIVFIGRNDWRRVLLNKKAATYYSIPLKTVVSASRYGDKTGKVDILSGSIRGFSRSFYSCFDIAIASGRGELRRFRNSPFSLIIAWAFGVRSVRNCIDRVLVWMDLHRHCLRWRYCEGYPRKTSF